MTIELTESKLRKIIKEEIEQMGMGAPEGAPVETQWFIHMSPRTARNHSSALSRLAREFGIDLKSPHPGEFVATGGDIEGFAEASSSYVRGKRIRAYVGW